MIELAVLIGSGNDRAIVRDSKMFEVFDAVGLEVPLHVVSCHRNPRELDEYCRETTADVFIAAAGVAAALPGVLSAFTSMEKVVIGVPLDDYGVDTCIRLPAGVPVLTPGVGKAGLRNAALAACQIVATSSPEVKARFAEFLRSTARVAQFNAPLDG